MRLHDIAYWGTKAATMPALNPSTGLKLVDVAACDAQDVNLAVLAARKAALLETLSMATGNSVILKPAEQSSLSAQNDLVQSAGLMGMQRNQKLQTQWLKGFGIFLCALLALAILDVIAKSLVQRNSAPLVNLARYIVVLGMAWILMLRRRVPFVASARQRGLLVGRGVMLGLVGVCFMPALQYLPLAEATAIYFLAPLIIVALSPVVLGEHVGAKQYLVVLVGMVGMLLIVHPSGNLSLVGSLLMLVAAFSFALVQLLTRKLAGRAPAEQQYFYAATICTVMGSVVLAFYWPQVWPDLTDIFGMLLVGALSGVGQFLLIRAFQFVPASTLAPFNYFHLMLAVIFSMVIFDQVPTMMAVMGMALITAAGLSLTLPMLISYWLTRRTRQ